MSNHKFDKPDSVIGLFISTSLIATPNYTIIVNRERVMMFKRLWIDKLLNCSLIKHDLLGYATDRVGKM